MFNRKLRLRFRRNYRRGRRQVEDIGVQAEERFERHFFRRLARLYAVRRFVLGWMLLLTLLISIVVAQTRALSSYYQELRPVPGGIYTEGILGAFTNANPIYAVSGVDGAVSRLVFSGLLKYNEKNKLVGDLAESWKVDKTGKVYTLILREGIFWHDGEPLDSRDVTFTYGLIQNPDTRSPLFSSWQKVKIQAVNARTITFTLPNVLSAFPHSLTNGIIPQHVLADIDPDQLRSDLFNTARPIGSGPFRFDAVQVGGNTPETREEQIGLKPYKQYHLGEPKLQQLILRTFRSEERLSESFKNQELNAVIGLDKLPDTFTDGLAVKEYSTPVTGQVMAFFNNSSDILKDKAVRQALVRAVDTSDIISGLGYPVIPTRAPLLRSHLGYNEALIQLGPNQKAANKLLDGAGWKQRNAEGIRTKKKRELRLRLHAQNSSDFTYLSQGLQSQWRAIGVDVEVVQPPDNELQTLISTHSYDILLYGISLGVDPDVFAYWHSSQADPRSQSRLNLSEYSSKSADIALEGGRTRIDPRLRVIKYKPFLAAWRQDAPALALYQPRFLYVVRGGLYNFAPSMVNGPNDRFNNVHNWMIRQAKVDKLSR